MSGVRIASYATDERPSVRGHGGANLSHPPREAGIFPRHEPSRGGKRAVDVVLSLLALIAFGPLMAIVAVLIFIFDPGPVLFSQRRIGLGGEHFKCLKFRTMSCNADHRLHALFARDPDAQREWRETQKLRHDPRITPLGRFLRLSSIDELPQFLNVLRGDMSIVGPRPIIDIERYRYGRHFADYCSVKPGLTGLWQVSGRNHTTYRRRVALDVFYCRNVSARLDLWVVLKTPGAILRREGAY